MKILILITLMMNLTSCRDRESYPRKSDFEQLSPVFSYVVINNKTYIDIDNSYCNARTYRISKERIGSITNNIRLSIYECDRMMGTAPREYSSFVSWLKDFRDWLLWQE